jgi:hypothetical protein
MDTDRLNATRRWIMGLEESIMIVAGMCDPETRAALVDLVDRIGEARYQWMLAHGEHMTAPREH